MVEGPPAMEGFKPFGIPMTNIQSVVLHYEEYEAIRLTDYEGKTHEEAAESMGVSRPTFTRVYEKARKTIAAAFVEGKAIFIEGGDYHMEGHRHTGYCICVNCDERFPHRLGIPCRESRCPNCGKKLMRENSYHHQAYLEKMKKKDEDSRSN